MNLKMEASLIPTELDTWMGSRSEGLRVKRQSLELELTLWIGILALT